jgi:hypothetical protein
MSLQFRDFSSRNLCVARPVVPCPDFREKVIFGLVFLGKVFPRLSGFLPANWESGNTARSEEKWAPQFSPH